MQPEPCEECGAAGLFWVEQNGRSRRLLCDVCAHRALRELDPIASRFLKAWLPLRSGRLSELGEMPAETSCPGCGLTYEELERQGLMGCATCYSAFGPAILPALAVLHGGGPGA